ncbi:MAG: VTT domain-containing protein [Bacteroidales bacterium]|nr:VTT domain-containing protein [Bacteroidales bacterium]
MDENNISNWISTNSVTSKYASVLLIISFLVLDLFLPIPSSFVMILSGKLLGFALGGLIAFLGAILSAMLGYTICRIGGHKMYFKLNGAGDSRKIEEWFEKYGLLAIIISRPIPMLTEILSCLAGLSKIQFKNFLLASALGTLPICFVYSYFGDIASTSNPLVALWIALIIPAIGWIVVKNIKRGKHEPIQNN